MTLARPPGPGPEAGRGCRGPRRRRPHLRRGDRRPALAERLGARGLRLDGGRLGPGVSRPRCCSPRPRAVSATRPATCCGTSPVPGCRPRRRPDRGNVSDDGPRPEPDAGTTGTAGLTARSDGSNVRRVTPVRGFAQHEQAVARCVRTTPSRPVRRCASAKRTSNLFRPREDEHAHPGLDVRASTASSRSMPRRDRRRAGHVHLRGPGRRDVAARTDPGRGAAAADHHPRRRGDRSRDRVDQLPQRAPARVGRSRWTCSPARGRCVTVRPGDALFDAFANSYGSLGYATRLRIALEKVPGVRRAAARQASTTPGCSPRRWPRSWRRSEHDGSARRRLRRDGLRAGGVLPDPARAGPSPRDAEAERLRAAPADLSTARSSSAAQTRAGRPHDARLPAGAGTPTGFWCSRAMGAQHPVVRRLWPRRYRRSDVFHRSSRLNDRTGIIDRIDRRKGEPAAGAGDPGRRGAAFERLEEFLEWFDREVGMRPVWPCRRWSLPAPAPAPPGRATRSDRGRRTSTSASGAPSRRPGRRRRACQPAPSRPRSTSSTATSRSTPRRSTTARPSTALYGGDRTSPALKATYDPDNRFLSHDKAVRRQ